MFDKETMDKIVQGAIIGALGDGAAERLMHDLVNKMLTTKVNKQGGTEYSSYHGSPDTPFLEYIVNRELRQVVEQTIIKFVKERTAEFEEQVRIQLTSDDRIAKSLTAMLDNMVKNGYLRVNIDFEKND